MHGAAESKDAAQQHDDFAERQFRDRSAVAVGIIEHGDPAMTAGGLIDLVDANAKSANREQTRSGFQHFSRDASLGANAEDSYVAQSRRELIFTQRSRGSLHFEAGGNEVRFCDAANVLEEKSLQLSSAMYSIPS